MNRNALIFGALILAGIGIIMAKRQWIVPPKGIPFIRFFREAEYMYALPPRLLARVAQQESNFDIDAHNRRSGARGMMQIIPRWHPDVIATDLDPRDDIFYAGRYLRENFDRFGTWAKALAAYNWGPGNLSRAIGEHGDDWLNVAPTETKNYVRDVTGDLGIA